MQNTWICIDEGETEQAARDIAGQFGTPVIFCLHGQLGAGKTVFCRAFIRHLLNNADEIIPSPTYTFVQTYDNDQIWHFDLYRMDNPHQLYDIGWEDALTANICLIEWPERMGNLKPQNSVDIVIEALDNGTRRITVKS